MGEGESRFPPSECAIRGKGKEKNEGASLLVGVDVKWIVKCRFFSSVFSNSGLLV